MKTNNNGRGGTPPPDKKRKRVVGTAPTARKPHKTAQRRNSAAEHPQANRPAQKNRMAINPSQNREAALREHARRRREKIRRRRLVVYSAALLLIAGVGITLSLTVFFHIETIAVEGLSKYTDEEIISKIEIHEQENLFLSDTKSAEKAILESFPYVGEVNIKRVLPSKILISVTETSAAFVVEEGGTYTLLDPVVRVLETGLAVPPARLPAIQGVEFESSNIGEKAVFKDEAVGAVMEKVMQAVNDCGIGEQDYFGETTPLSERGNIDVVDLTDTLNIRLIFDGRLTLELGMPTDLEYKMEFAKTTIDKLSADARGTLDLSVLKKATFSPEKTEPPAQETTVQTPEEGKGADSQKLQENNSEN